LITNSRHKQAASEQFVRGPVLVVDKTLQIGRNGMKNQAQDRLHSEEPSGNSFPKKLNYSVFLARMVRPERFELPAY